MKARMLVLAACVAARADAASHCAGVVGFACKPTLPSLRKTQVGCCATRAPGHELWRSVEQPSTLRGPLSPEQLDEFYEQGFIIVRGLIDGELLDRVREAKCSTDLPGTEYETLSFNAWRQDPTWLEVALTSKVAQAVAQLTPSVASGEEGLHIIKDAVFCFKGDEDNPGKSGCDWHVDDAFFWPAADDADGPGVNVWVALDPVTSDGGGLCVAARSHTEEFLDCRQAISVGPQGTCSMSDIFPQGRARLEERCVRPEMLPGDAIVHTRFCFHRTDPFTPGSAALRGPGVRRYSVRYMPSSARVSGLDKMGLDGRPIFFKGQRIDSLDPARFPRVPL